MLMLDCKSWMKGLPYAVQVSRCSPQLGKQRRCFDVLKRYAVVAERTSDGPLEHNATRQLRARGDSLLKRSPNESLHIEGKIYCMHVYTPQRMHGRDERLSLLQ